MAIIEEWYPYLVSIFEPKAGQKVGFLEMRHERCKQVHECLDGGERQQVVLGQPMYAALHLGVSAFFGRIEYDPVQRVQQLRLRGRKLVEGRLAAGVKKRSATMHHMWHGRHDQTPP